MTEPLFDSLRIARAAASEPGLVFLDSAVPGAGCSSLFRDPAAVYTFAEGAGWLSDGRGRREAPGDPFYRVAEVLREHPDWTAAGYWGYDLRYCLERLPRRAARDLELPDCWVGFYPGGDRGAEGQRDGETEGQRDGGTERQRDGETEGRRDRGTEGRRDRGTERQRDRGTEGRGDGERERAPAPNTQHLTPNSSLTSTFTREGYEAAVRRVLEYIAAGDCYQVNLSQRFSAPFGGSPWALYERLRAVSPAPYAAFLNCGDDQVLSSSPELFLRVRDGMVETRPIKGTRPRGATPEEDAARAAELLASAKDRAELLMIVDLERNDLGRVCEYGSVTVPELYQLESYANVHHLVATVRGRLRPELGPLDCLRAAFPGGSITGAPKIRAMEIIEELEPVRRGVYTGAIGWVDGRGNAEWNIAIRTMTVTGGAVYFHAGGGIVADSDPAAEYDETLAKASGMVRALEALA